MSTATVRTPVRFDAPSRRVEGGYAIYPNALLFEEGHYPDKQFSLGPADMDAAIANFTPVGGAIEHTPFLRGRALTVRSIRRDEANPKLLRGEVAVPLGLDELIDDAERSLSAEWDRETKRLVGAALTLNPRIKGASLVAAFADEALTHDDDPALLKETIKALAAFCACQAEAPTTRTVEAPMPMKKEQLKQYLDSLDAEADIDDGAASMILFPDAGEGDDMEEAFDDAPEPTQFSADPEAIALRAEIESLKAERRREKAALFAAEMRTQGRIAPYEVPLTESVMFAAMTVDAREPGTVASFTQGGKVISGNLEAMIRASYGQREARVYDRPQIAAGTGAAALAQFSDAPESDEAYAKRVLAKHNGRNRIGNGSA